MGKRRDLSTQSSTTGNLVFSQAALLLVLASKTLELCILVPHQAFEVELPKLILVKDGLEFVANPEDGVSNMAWGMARSEYQYNWGHECGRDIRFIHIHIHLLVTRVSFGTHDVLDVVE